MQSFYVDTVDSTNEEAKRLLLRGEVSDVAYILAREQTAGKGSRGRSWVSPSDAGLYLSIVQWFEAGLDPEALSIPMFTLAAGVACAEVLHEALSLDVRLKPINDLYISGAKLGGILVESVVEGGRIRAIITGVGINVRDVPRALPDGSAPAVSLQFVLSPHALGGFDPRGIAGEMARSIVRWHAVVVEGRCDTIRDAWQRLARSGDRFPIDVG